MTTRRNFLAAAVAAAGAVALAPVARAGTVLQAAAGAKIAVPGTGIGIGLDAKAFAASRRYVATSFGDIAWVERGGDTGIGRDAQPVALFLHGFPLNGFQWRDAIALLSPYRRCIAPDFMALGHTRPRPGQALDPDAQAAMLVAFLDALGIGAVDIVASDSGGAIAQLLMVRHPHRVRSLLLANCDTEHECPPAAMLPVIELSRQGRYADAWLGEWLRDKALARSAEGIGGMCYADPSNPDDEAITAYFAPVLASEERKALLHAYAIALERNALAGIGQALRASRVPVRTVWGMADGIFSPQGADYLERVPGNSRGVRRLPDAKLFWPEERPGTIAEEALALWNAGGASA